MEQLGEMIKLLHYWDNQNPWMILMDEKGKKLQKVEEKLCFHARHYGR